MPTTVIYPEWRDENALTCFPFEENSSLTGESGFTIPASLFVDGLLYPVGNTGGLYLSSIEIASEPKQLTFSINSTPTQVLATGTVNLDDPTPVVYFYDVYGRPAGLLVSNESGGEYPTLDVLHSWGEGIHSFVPSATSFAVKAIVPMPQRGVRGILIPSGELMTGEVWIVGERGVVVRKKDNNLRIDVIGVVLSQQQTCQEQNERGASMQDVTGETFIPINISVPNFLRTINNEGPDAEGGFHIVTPQPKSILHINSHENQLSFELVGA